MTTETAVIADRTGLTFQKILQWSLNSKSNSRPPKIEVTGILTPVSKVLGAHGCKFRLAGGSKVYLLRLNQTLEELAKSMEWEEVTVRGYLNMDSNILEVERILQAEDMIAQ